MRRVLAGCSMLVMLLGSGLQPAAAKGVTAVPAGHTVGNYTLHLFWDTAGPVTKTLMLEGRGRVQTLDGDNGTWSIATGTGKITIALTKSGVTASLSGVKTAYGLCKPKSPGTMTNTSGDSGTWYAKRIP